jgi:hypothetical protein
MPNSRTSSAWYDPSLTKGAEVEKVSRFLIFETSVTVKLGKVLLRSCDSAVSIDIPFLLHVVHTISGDLPASYP